MSVIVIRMLLCDDNDNEGDSLVQKSLVNDFIAINTKINDL